MKNEGEVAQILLSHHTLKWSESGVRVPRTPKMIQPHKTCQTPKSIEPQNETSTPLPMVRDEAPQCITCLHTHPFIEMIKRGS